MVTEKNTGKTLDGFLTAYQAVSVPVRNSVRDRIIQLTGWSRKTFYNKMNADTALRPFEMEIVKFSFSEYGIDYETGEELVNETADGKLSLPF